MNVETFTTGSRTEENPTYATTTPAAAMVAAPANISTAPIHLLRRALFCNCNAEDYCNCPLKPSVIGLDIPLNPPEPFCNSKGNCFFFFTIRSRNSVPSIHCYLECIVLGSTGLAFVTKTLKLIVSFLVL